MAQRLEQLAEAGGLVVQTSVAETVPIRMPFDYDDLGTQQLKGFSQSVRASSVRLSSGEQIPEPDKVGGEANLNIDLGESDSPSPETPRQTIHRGFAFHQHER